MNDAFIQKPTRHKIESLGPCLIFLKFRNLLDTKLKVKGPIDSNTKFQNEA